MKDLEPHLPDSKFHILSTSPGTSNYVKLRMPFKIYLVLFDVFYFSPGKDVFPNLYCYTLPFSVFCVWFFCFVLFSILPRD